jgi:hypothetical protein
MPATTKHDEAIIKRHMLHLGLYRRVANKLEVDPSYVSRVATGKRKNLKVRRALMDELRKLQRLLR